MVIFLNNFLALLMKVDGVGKDSSPTLGDVMVAVNVLLFLAVLSASCFSLWQSIDDSRENQNAFTDVEAMLTAHQGAANIIRNTQEGSAFNSSSAVSGGHDVPSRSFATVDTI